MRSATSGSAGSASTLAPASPACLAQSNHRPGSWDTHQARGGSWRGGGRTFLGGEGHGARGRGGADLAGKAGSWVWRSGARLQREGRECPEWNREPLRMGLPPRPRGKAFRAGEPPCLLPEAAACASGLHHHFRGRLKFRLCRRLAVNGDTLQNSIYFIVSSRRFDVLHLPSTS